MSDTSTAGGAHHDPAPQRLVAPGMRGSDTNPLRIAIFGAGPSGFFAAEELLTRKDHVVVVDLFDRLPTPYGLVRGGVAPDHQHTKEVVKQFERTAARPGFRFFGNVAFGTDLSLEDVLHHYDQVLLATGAEADRRLGIPGEDLPGSHPATAFVGWFNGHPDYHDLRFDLDAEQVIVIGHGNVAVDVARILSRSVDELAHTDIAEYALEALRQSHVREIHLLGRRGPAQAAFSHPELRELTTMHGADLVVRPEDIEADMAAETVPSHHHHHRNIELLFAHSAKGEGDQLRKVRMRFFVSPVEILGFDRVEGLRVERTRLVEDATGVVQARGTGVFEDIPATLILRSVGYKGERLPGLPFDERNGVVPHHDGRVIDPVTSEVLPRVYVAGWIKRGPTGVIGTNRSDAVATVRSMLADADGGSLRDLPAAPPEDIETLLARKQIQAVSFAAWTQIDHMEIAAGARRGKPREKFTTRAGLLAAARTRPL